MTEPLREAAAGAVKIALWRRALDLLDPEQLTALDAWLGTLLNNPAYLADFAARLGLEGSEYLPHLVRAAKDHQTLLRERIATIQAEQLH